MFENVKFNQGRFLASYIQLLDSTAKSQYLSVHAFTQGSTMPNETNKERSSPKCSQEEVSCADLDPNLFKSHE